MPHHLGRRRARAHELLGRRRGGTGRRAVRRQIIRALRVRVHRLDGSVRCGRGGRAAVTKRDDVARRRAGREDLADTLGLQPRDVLGRHDAAAEDQHVVDALLAQELEDPAEQVVVRAGQDREPDGVDVFLDRGRDDLLGALVEARCRRPPCPRPGAPAPRSSRPGRARRDPASPRGSAACARAAAAGSVIRVSFTRAPAGSSRPPPGCAPGPRRPSASRSPSRPR